MKHNFDIRLAAIFGEDVPLQRLQNARASVKMRHAKRNYFRAPPGEAILQEFDGRYGYLYSMEVYLTETIHIPIKTKQPDLHLFYVMATSTPVRLTTADGSLIADFGAERARYLYLPAGDYLLTIPRSVCHLFGFYFDGGIFRDGNEKEFPFLQGVLTNYRAKITMPDCSIDFWVGPQTRSVILYLFQNLNRGLLSNEDLISRTLFRLIELSKKKIAMQEPYDVQAAYVEAIRLRIAFELEDGNGIPQLGVIAADLHVSLSYLSKLHKAAYSMSLQEYAKTTLVNMAVQMLQSGYTVREVSNHFDYSAQSAFTRLLLSKTGKTPSEWMGDCGD